MKIEELNNFNPKNKAESSFLCIVFGCYDGLYGHKNNINSNNQRLVSNYRRGYLWGAQSRVFAGYDNLPIPTHGFFEKNKILIEIKAELEKIFTT